MKAGKGWGYGYNTQDKEKIINRTEAPKRTAKQIAKEMSDIQDLPIIGYEPRKISKETMEFFDVHTGLSQEDRSPAEHWYPYTDEEGKIVGWKCRVLPKDFEAKGCIGKIKGMFGKSKCYGSTFLIVVEGEQDAISAHEMMKKLKPERSPYNVVSLPTGTDEEGRIHPLVKRELEWLSGFKKIVLCLDMDKPGQNTAKTLAEYLCAHTEVSLATLPLKDTAAMWEAGEYRAWADAINKAKPYRPEAIVEGNTLNWEDFRKNKQAGIELPYPLLQKKTWGLRKGEISLVVAGPGLGKSTFVQQICKEVSDKGYKVANIALETPFEDLVNFYVAMDRGIPKHKLVFNQALLTDEQYKESFDRVAKQMHFFKWWGKIDSEVLVKKMHYFAKALDVDFIMLDHISIAVSGQDDERLEIDRLFEALTQLVVDTGVGVIAVMHLKKSPGKNYNSGSPVELEDIRGSAGAAQMSWNIWSVERNQQGDNPNLCKIRVLKNRSIGPTGEADYLLYDDQTGYMNVYNAEV